MRSAAELDRLLKMMDVGAARIAHHEPVVRHDEPAAPAGHVVIAYVAAGAVAVTVGDRAARRCGHGWMVLIPASLPSSFRGVEDGEPPGLVIGLAEVRLSGAAMLDRVKVPIFADLRETPLVAPAMAELARLAAAPDAAMPAGALSAALMKTCILILLQDFFRRPGIDLKIIGALADDRLASVIAAVLERPQEPHSLTSMAALAGLSRSTFSRLFDEAMGQPPTEFVAKTRLYHAAEQLRTGGAPVKAVAASVGFSSRSHFSRAFRDAYGLDPTAYRQRHAGPAAAAIPQDLRKIPVT